VDFLPAFYGVGVIVMFVATLLDGDRILTYGAIGVALSFFYAPWSLYAARKEHAQLAPKKAVRL
jgi:hypothetical protein